MQQVQLYINDKRVEMFDYESVSITDSLKNVKDVSKIFTEYSQTFSLPASRVNNKAFSHYYNSDIEDGFDARIRVPAKLELNSIPFKSGYIKLEGVDLKDNKANKYRVTFFGNTITLKELLGEDLLSSLSWLENFSFKESGDALLYDEEDIETYLTTEVSKTVDSVSYVNPIQVPLITHSQRLYYNSVQGHSHADNNSGNVYYDQGGGHKHGVKWNELKYALKLNIIIKAIEKKYTIANGYSQNLVFSDDFFQLETSNDFSDLYMWLHRVKGEVTNGGQVEYYTHPIVNWEDGSNDLGSMSNNVLTLREAPQTYLKLFVNVSSGFESVPYSFKVFRNGVTVYESGTITGDTNFVSIDVEFNAGYTVEVTNTQPISFDYFNWEHRAYDSDTDSTLERNYYTASGGTSFSQSFDFSILQQIPKMKVLDFLTAVFKMFNLVAYVDGSEVVVKTLDSFYADGNSYDITKYIDVEASQINTALPFREIIFGYEGLGSFLAKRHNELFNEEWGTEEYKGGNSTIFTGGIFQYKIPFEHMKFERLIDLNELNTNPTFPVTDVQWGYCVDDKQDSYIGKPIVFYIARKAAQISFIDVVDGDNEPTSHKPINNYFAPSNSNLLFPNFEDRQSINFSPEADEWELTTNKKSLFNTYHSNYISNVFNKGNRLTKLSAYLPLRLLLKYKLSDRFEVAGKSYKINSIETNLHNGKSDLELIGDFAPKTLDLTPPTAPTNLALVPNSQTSSGFEVSWTASTDDNGILGYRIELNQEPYGTLDNVTSYVFTGLQGGTNYRVAVFAFDTSGNESGISNILDTFTLQ
tara:strand:+ start:506 stop:2935 length:2430 start_codon:yes stop_codon:yes gene_type:complete